MTRSSTLRQQQHGCHQQQRCSAKAVVVIVILFLSLCIAEAVARKFDHVIVVMEENRSFDHLLGWSKQLGIDGLTGQECNPVSTLEANSPLIFVDTEAPYIAPVDPDHTTYATTSKIFGMRQLLEKNYTETMSGFVEWERFLGSTNSTRYGRVMSMFPPEKLPVLNQLAAEFAVMDRFFASVPGCTWPNRQFMLSGTSGGNTETFFWYNGTPGLLYPQKTIFDQVAEEGMTWRNYYVDSPWELMMETIASNPDNVQPLDQFYADAASGNLPNFAFINPRGGINMTTGEGSNDMHPDHDAALAEKYYKEIYEALRASPKWNNTLMILTFDEHGGFYDHVAPPSVGIPAPDDHPAVPDFYFTFDRLGLRIPTILISAWTPKGTVINRPPADQMPTNTSEYELTSIMSTTRKLLNMTSGPLTRRDAWSATFEHAFGEDSPRTDCPLTLVPAPPPSTLPDDREEDRRLSHLQRDIATMVHHLSGAGHTTKEMQALPEHARAHPDELLKQGELSQWLQDRYHHHHKKTVQWSALKQAPLSALGYRVVTGATLSADWVFGDMTWDLNSGSNCSYQTISTRKLHNATTGVPYCLRYNLSSTDDVVTILPCYPTSSPCFNRDSNQHWVFSSTDSSIRPADSSELCLTTNYNTGDEKMYLNLCNGTVGQHWSWFGSAPGAGDLGYLFFGIGVANLGVVVV